MNYKIRVTSVVGGETVSPTDMKLIPAGRNTGIQPLHKGYRLGIKTIFHRAYIIDVYIWSLGLFSFGVCSWWCIGSFLVSIIFLYRKTALWHILSYYL